MPRQARGKSCNDVYHCMLRGINKQDIFFEDKDYLRFQEIIERTKKKFSYQLYSYVLMPNHIHLEIKDENHKLSQILHSMTTSYANYFNKKYQRNGHLFDNRFKSKSVESSYYILNLVRYIHQNPVKAGISKMENYKWSSYLEYFKNIPKDNLTDTKEVLEMFSHDEEESRREFFEFNSKTIKFEDSIELLEYEMRNKLTDEEVTYFIKEKLGITNIQEIQKYNNKYRNSIIKKLKDIKGISQPQMARILGINITLIKKILYKK